MFCCIVLYILCQIKFKFKHFTKKVARNVLLQQHLQEQTVFTKVVPVEEGWVVDVRGIMLIFKTVMNCIVFN